MYTILVAVDQNKERSIGQARAVTEYPFASDSIEAVLVHVSREVQSDEGGKIDLQDYAARPESVDLVRDHLESEGVDTRIEERSGDPAEEVLRTAREVDSDQIVVGGRKRSPVGKAIFGSVSQEIILNANCHVLVANENQ